MQCETRAQKSLKYGEMVKMRRLLAQIAVELGVKVARIWRNGENETTFGADSSGIGGKSR